MRLIHGQRLASSLFLTRYMIVPTARAVFCASARECSSTRAFEPSHSKTTRALELLHLSTRVLKLEKYSHTTRMTSANHSREFFHSRISSTRPVLYMYVYWRFPEYVHLVSCSEIQVTFTTTDHKESWLELG